MTLGLVEKAGEKEKKEEKREEFASLHVPNMAIQLQLLSLFLLPFFGLTGKTTSISLLLLDPFFLLLLRVITFMYDQSYFSVMLEKKKKKTYFSVFQHI